MVHLGRSKTGESLVLSEAMRGQWHCHPRRRKQDAGPPPRLVPGDCGRDGRAPREKRLAPDEGHQQGKTTAATLRTIVQAE